MAAGWLLTLGASSVTSAQTMDQTKLIDALSERGMDQLLLRLAETGEFDDPVEARLIEISRLQLASRDAALPAAERYQAFGQARTQLRALIDDPEIERHPLRPVLRTDLAEMLLVHELEGFRRTATGFYELGVPTDTQRRAFEQAVPVALAMTLQTDNDFRSLENRLSRDTALRDKLEASLTLNRIFDEYRDQKSAYFGACAAYYAALLPDDNPYYQSLGSVPGQAKTPSAERKRLLNLVVRKLEPFTGVDAGNTALQARAQSLAGRATLALGDAARADRQWLTPAMQSTDWNLDRLAASIAKAKALEAQGRSPAAQALLEGLPQKLAVRSRTDYRLLATDALHLFLLRQAQPLPASERTAAEMKAYEVYFELINDPSLGDNAAAVRNLVFDRWASTLGDETDAQKLNDLPAVVRMAVADISRRRGAAAAQQGDADAASRWLGQAIRASQTLSDRAAVGDAVWASGRYSLAYATYAANPAKLGSLLEAVEVATTVAEITPTQPAATDAIDLATRIAESLHRQYADQPGVAAAFERSMRALYESGDFETTQPSDDRLVYYAFAVFEAKGDYEKAIELYSQQLQSHRNYVQAQAQRVAAYTAWYKQLPPGDRRNTIESDLLDASRKVEALAQVTLEKPKDAYQSASAKRALANSMLAQAQVYATRGAIDRALEVIADFKKEFADQPELIQSGLRQEILLLVEAGRLGDAEQAAGEMMGRFPDAAASVINSVLNDTEQTIAQLGDDSPQSARLADAAAAMSKLLVDWARGQGYDANQMLPYHLVVLKSLRIADRSDEALAYLSDTGLDQEFANNVDVLFEKAKALVGKGDPASLKAASPLLNRLIGGLSEPYPATYWEAWVLRLRINLLLNENVGDVSRRVRQLQVRFPDLGGAATRQQLENLAAEAERALGR